MKLYTDYSLNLYYIYVILQISTISIMKSILYDGEGKYI